MPSLLQLSPQAEKGSRSLGGARDFILLAFATGSVMDTKP
jgi:hypothetical protein